MNPYAFIKANRVVVEDPNMKFLSKNLTYVEYYLKDPIDNPHIVQDDTEPDAVHAVKVVESESGEQWLFTLKGNGYLSIPKTNILGTFYQTESSSYEERREQIWRESPEHENPPVVPQID